MRLLAKLGDEDECVGMLVRIVYRCGLLDV